MWAISVTGLVLAVATIGMFFYQKITDDGVTGEEE